MFNFSIMSKSRVLATALLLTMSSGSMAYVSKDLPLPTEEPTPLELAKQVFYANHFYAFNNFGIGNKINTMAVLVNKSEDGRPRTIALERYLNNNYDDGNISFRDLAIFRSGKLKGTGLLVTGYEDDEKSQSYTIWLPQLRKTRRFAEPQHDETWGNSVFTFGDVTLRKPEDEEHEILGTKTFRSCLGVIEELEGKRFRYARKMPKRSCRHVGKEVYGLKSTPKRESWWYDYRVSFVDTSSYADYRTLYYKDGELIKVIDRDWGLVSQDETGDPRSLFWKYWYGLDLKDGRQSWAVIPRDVIEYNTDKPNNYWTEKTLRKIKR